MSNYKHGSLKLSHENAGLTVPSIQWLGIRSRDVLSGNEQDAFSGLLKLSARDRKKAIDMLERSEVLIEDGAEREWRRELQVMLMLNVKAEMEILAEREGGVKGWVEEKLMEAVIKSQTHGDLLGTDRVVDRTFGEDGFPSSQENEEFLLDTHETPEMLGVGLEEFESCQADEDLFDAHQMADTSPAGAGSPVLSWDEEL